MKNWLRRWLGIVDIDAVYLIRTSELRPSDVLVLHSDDYLSMDTCEQIKAQLLSQLPDRKVLVLTGGLKFGILSPREIA